MMRSLALPLIALAVTGGLAIPVRADSISGTLSGDATLTLTGTPGVYIANFSGEGSDGLLGAFDLQGVSNIDFSNPPAITLSDGTFSLIFGDGTLFGTGSGVGHASGLGTATTSSDLVITGGTGAFAGASGDVLLHQVITTTGPLSESITATYSGTLVVTPEPASLALFASGAVVLFRRKKAGSLQV